MTSLDKGIGLIRNVGIGLVLSGVLLASGCETTTVRDRGHDRQNYNFRRERETFRGYEGRRREGFRGYEKRNDWYSEERRERDRRRR